MNGHLPLEGDVPKNLDGASEPASTVFQLARYTEQARLEAGLGMEELLKKLREQRDRYYREHYTDDQSK